MGVFPMILVPTLAVPVSALLHVFGLAGLLREVRLPSGLVPLSHSNARQAGS
jgi:hypothetical protein